MKCLKNRSLLVKDFALHEILRSRIWSISILISFSNDGNDKISLRLLVLPWSYIRHNLRFQCPPANRHQQFSQISVTVTRTGSLTELSASTGSSFDSSRVRKDRMKRNLSPRVRESGFRNLVNFSFVESRILGFGIQNPRLWNPNPGLWNPESWASESTLLGFGI